MPKYNSGLKYNSRTNYNSAPIIIFVNDSGSGGDVANIFVSVPIDDAGTGTDSALAAALISSIDSGLGADTVYMQYTTTVDDAGTGTDIVSIPDITVSVNDSGSGSDTINVIVNLFMNETGIGNDNMSVTGNIKATDTGQGNDSMVNFATIPLSDNANGLDIIKVAKTYYHVNSNGILQPLNVRILRDSHIDLMPEIKIETDTIPGKHGEIHFDSKLGVRAIELSVATEEYTVEQREALKRTMAQYLNPASDAKALVFADDLEKQYMVKYAGKIDLSQHHPTWMQFVIPFKSATSYIIGSFGEEHIGSGTLTNVGNQEAPLTIEIVGPATNPSVTVGTSTLTYSGTVNGGSMLVIDTEKMTVELDGVNALPDYSGGFPWLSVGDTAVIAASTGITVFRYRGRWL